MAVFETTLANKEVPQVHHGRKPDAALAEKIPHIDPVMGAVCSFESLKAIASSSEAVSVSCLVIET